MHLAERARPKGRIHLYPCALLSLRPNVSIGHLSYMVRYFTRTTFKIVLYMSLVFTPTTITQLPISYKLAILQKRHQPSKRSLQKTLPYSLRPSDSVASVGLQKTGFGAKEPRFKPFRVRALAFPSSVVSIDL